MSLLWRSIDEGVAQAKKGVALRAFGLGGMNEGSDRVSRLGTASEEALAGLLPRVPRGPWQSRSTDLPRRGDFNSPAPGLVLHPTQRSGVESLADDLALWVGVS
jgi:hypothetical protein